jgi:hypothetical protein
METVTLTAFWGLSWNFVFDAHIGNGFGFGWDYLSDGGFIVGNLPEGSH